MKKNYMCYCFTCKRVQNETNAVTLKNFEEEDNPELPKGKTDKAKLEEMTPENKHIHVVCTQLVPKLHFELHSHASYLDALNH